LRNQPRSGKHKKVGLKPGFDSQRNATLDALMRSDS
jgi:hypothetical protein